VAEHDRVLERVVETLREPVRIDPDLSRRVMAAIEELPPPALPDPTLRHGWLGRRWTIRLSPLGGLALAAGLAALVLLTSRLSGPSAGPAPVIASAASGEPTQFVLVAPEAATVTVVGDFNDWNMGATPLARQAGDGVWWVTLPLSPGRYRYAFVVNGSDWRSDPNAPSAEDEFGRRNSVVTIGGA
jgi:hypothetical protein